MKKNLTQTTLSMVFILGFALCSIAQVESPGKPCKNCKPKPVCVKAAGSEAIPISRIDTPVKIDPTSTVKLDSSVVIKVEVQNQPPHPPQNSFVPPISGLKAFPLTATSSGFVVQLKNYGTVEISTVISIKGEWLEVQVYMPSPTKVIGWINVNAPTVIYI